MLTVLADGVSVEYHESVDLPKKSAWVAISDSGVIGLPIVWDTGESELDIGALGVSRELVGSQELQGANELDRILDRFISFALEVRTSDTKRWRFTLGEASDSGVNQVIFRACAANSSGRAGYVVNWVATLGDDGSVSWGLGG